MVKENLIQSLSLLEKAYKILREGKQQKLQESSQHLQEAIRLFKQA